MRYARSTEVDGNDASNTSSTRRRGEPTCVLMARVRAVTLVIEASFAALLVLGVNGIHDGLEGQREWKGNPAQVPSLFDEGDQVSPDTQFGLDARLEYLKNLRGGSLAVGDGIMQKVVLITGSTDGIGLDAAKMMHAGGHRVLLHGRSAAKLEKAKQALGGGDVETYVADLSSMDDVEKLAKEVTETHSELDVLINNAGVYKVAGNTVTAEGLDVRFAVNTIAPYLLTIRLLPLIPVSGRVINLSSAAQSPVNLDALTGRVKLSSEMAAYGQSKLAITMWSHAMAQQLQSEGPAIIPVNPGSLLATKMVREGFGMAGSDVRQGSEILSRLALAEEFHSATGKYFDNDAGQFASPHPDGENLSKCRQVVEAIRGVLGAKHGMA